jgi:hypothetical protein
VAKSVIDSHRGNHSFRVYTYRNLPLEHIYKGAWKRARIKAAKARALANNNYIAWGFANLRVHNLKHTFRTRLRAAWLQLETMKVLLECRNRNITSHYSAPEIEELLVAANRVCEGTSRKSPALTNLKRKTTWINPSGQAPHCYFKPLY